MKKILFALMLCVSMVMTTNANAQNGSYNYLKYRIERQERIENGNYDTAFGLNAGYSSENYLKLGGKLGGKKMGVIVDSGIMVSPPKSIKENENYVYYNNFTFNVGLTYNILPNFYIGILSGVNHIGYDETINNYETKTILNDNYFNCGIVLGCIIKGVDLSVSYSKVEQFSFQIGFLFRD